jgi:ABC-2 type transport system permease protein
LQVLSQAFPLQHYLPVVRSIMLKGATFSSVWYDAVWLVALAVVSIAIASMSLRRQMA